MPLSFEVTGADKDQLVVSLAALLLNDAKVEVSAENINTVVSSSGNTVPAYYPTLFSTYIEKAGGVEKFFSAPSAGGAGMTVYLRDCSLSHVNCNLQLLLVLPLPPLLLPHQKLLRSPRKRRLMLWRVEWTCSAEEVPRLVTIRNLLFQTVW